MSVDDVYRDGDTEGTHADRTSTGRDAATSGRDGDTVWLTGPGAEPADATPTVPAGTGTTPAGRPPIGPATGPAPAGTVPAGTVPAGMATVGAAAPTGVAQPEAGTSGLTADPVDDLAETPAMIRRHLHARKPGPFRRFVLYASGVDTRVLWYVPIDETEFVVQGTLVTLTALVAALAGLAAASFLVYGHFVLSPVTLAVGLAWGLLIFFFDRALVSGTYNAYRFKRREVEALRDDDAGSVWAHLLDDAPDRRGLVRRAGEIARVALVASLRVVRALATSFIAAEMALFLIFQPEISARAAYLESSRHRPSASPPSRPTSRWKAISGWHSAGNSPATATRT